MIKESRLLNQINSDNPSSLFTLLPIVVALLCLLFAITFTTSKPVDRLSTPESKVTLTNNLSFLNANKANKLATEDDGSYTYTFSGTLTDQNGLPMSGVTVALNADDGNYGSATTDSEGNFSLTAIPDEYRVTLLYESGNPLYTNWPSTFQLSPNHVFDLEGGDLEQNFQVDMVSLTVGVNDSTGNPIEGASIFADAESATDAPSITPGISDSTNISYTISHATTDANGQSTIIVPDGAKYGQSSGAKTGYDNIYATLPDGINAYMPSSLTVNGDTSVMLTAPVTHVFTGTLTDSDGNPVQGISVVLNSADGNNESAETGSDGSFSVVVPADTYNIVLVDNNANATYPEWPSSFTIYDPDTYDLTNNDLTQNLQLAMTSLTITVDDSNGNPVSNALVQGDGENGTGSPLVSGSSPTSISGVQTNGYTDSNGQIVFTVPVGTNYGQTASSTASYDNIIATLPNGETVYLSSPITVQDNTSVTLTPSAATYTYSGTITDQNGNPLAGATILLYGTNGEYSTAQVQSDGSFTANVSSDTYNVGVTYSGAPQYTNWPSGYTVIDQGTVDISQDTSQALVLDMSPLTVSVQDGSGNSVSGSTVELSGQEGMSSSLDQGPSETALISNVTAAQETDSNGQAVFLVPDGTQFGQSSGAGSNYDNIISYNSDGTNFFLASPLTVSGETSAVLEPSSPNIQPPSNLTATSPTSTSPALSWDAVSGATSYNIYRNGVDIGSTTATTYTDSSLTSNGTYSYYVTAVNSAGESSPSNTVTVIFGTAPTITSTNSASTGMRVPFSFAVTTAGDPTASLSEIGNLPAGITFKDNGDGTAIISGEAAASTSGTYPITITASNGISPDATQTFTLTVTTASTAPTITSANNDTVTYGSAFSFTVTTDGYPVPTIKKTGSLPNGVTFTNNGDGTATIAGTPAGGTGGVYNLTLTAKNSAGTSAQPFTLTINRAPTINNSAANVTTSVGTAFSLTINTKGYPTPSLAEAGTLPSGVTFTDNGDGTATFSGTPAVGSGGAYPITVTATSSQGTDTYSFTVKVDEGPVITSNDSATAIVGSPFSFQVTDTGYPAPSITKTGTLPKGLTWDGSTKAISGTPASGTDGTYTITFTSANSTGTVTQTFTLTVQG